MTKPTIALEWISDVDEEIARGVVSLLNDVSVRERNMGYNGRLTSDEVVQIRDNLTADAKSGLVMIARDGDQIVGTVTLGPNKLPARRHVVEIKRCVIAPSHRGRFLARAWQLIQQKCAERDYNLIVIDVRTDHPPTVELWKKLGFIEFGRLPRFAIMDGKNIDGVFMYMDLLPVDAQN